MVEGFNGISEEHLCKVIDKGKIDQDTHLVLFLLAYCASVHQMTGFTPAKPISAT